LGRAIRIVLSVSATAQFYQIACVCIESLVEFFNGHILDDWRFLLALSEADRLFFVKVDSTKDFIIFVQDLDKIVIVYSATFPFLL
jgi:hypothetical protein